MESSSHESNAVKGEINSLTEEREALRERIVEINTRLRTLGVMETTVEDLFREIGED
jgi:prefoldin subunit 5